MRQRQILAEFAATPKILAIAAIDTPLRLAHFLAQTVHESDGFCTTEEYASGKAYEGRRDLGNTQSGDGVRYKGRGLIQVTGRANYMEFSRWCSERGLAGPRFPTDLAFFPGALLSAVWFWQTRKLNALADKDDIIDITKKINGGLNGLESRRAYLARAKAVLGIVPRSQAAMA
ncbi:glycoside hydrolase family 19 protein [Candidatus Tokpelaia sp.]|uniref:glycoside hydrolase family 19 protein n=1 Tax=Candidatus Tokpelaia sp. TaxID=2233777 RepID=UPI0012383F3F|nr:peptidoglycan-binding protein [Candidatus Tokpelaia sp.]KAA6406259.1 peptidoglycan-binding protein [Candidatus Tokpelaia sp.]